MMTFPAYDELVEDDGLPRTAVKLYRWLLRKYPQGLREPVTVKTSSAAMAIRRDRHYVGKALQVLIDRGYLIDCGRKYPNQPQTSPRLVMMPFLRQPTPAWHPNVPRTDAA